MSLSDRRDRLSRAVLYCLVSDPETARAALAGGADVIQLRAKGSSGRDLLALAEGVVAACRSAGALSIVNDRADVALASGADGVHLGQDDLPYASVRAFWHDGLIGISTHSDDEIERALSAGADYIGIGCCFPSRTKEVDQNEGLALVARWAARLEVPFFPLGGVDLKTVERLCAVGAKAAAVGAAISGASDPAAAARALRARLSEGSSVR